jgi:C1A family cysteine protease/predicted secreted protein
MRPRTNVGRLAAIGAVALALGLALALASMALAAPPSQEPPAEEIVVTADDHGQEIELGEGQLLVVRLQANPSTGYGWQVSEPGVQPILRQADSAEFQPESELLGAPGTQILRFEGVREGDSTLMLEYRRPWEAGVEPAGTFHLQVRAQGPFNGPRPSHTASAPTDTPPSLDEQSAQDLPSSFNWCDLGGCTQVKDQGRCGSCWAFGTAGPLELGILIREGVPEDLSEQYLVSCNTEGWGCNGGLWAHDYHAWKVPPGEDGAGGVEESSFPYVARDGSCAPPHPHEYQIDAWTYIGGERGIAPVVDIKRAIYEHGPVAAAVCVNSAFQSYSEGIFGGPGCLLVNHAVVLVGWDDEQGDAGVWMLRNSWGADWGEDGYMHIAYGASNVGWGANYVTYVPSSCYALDTSVVPDGAGSISLEPPPNCQGDQYEPGTEVRLVARAASRWHFVNWSGAATGEGSVATVIVDSHKSATAHFQSDLCIPWLVLSLGLGICCVYKRRS